MVSVDLTLKCYGTPLVLHIHTLGILYVYTCTTYIKKICHKICSHREEYLLLCVCVDFHENSCHILSELGNDCVSNGTFLMGIDMRL